MATFAGMDKDVPLILVTNDDGIVAPGIRALVEAVIDLGQVVVVAPDSFQSAMGHAITINNLLRLDKINSPVTEHSSAEFVRRAKEIAWYQCSGTPVDCVKIAIDKILPRKPDLCVSGINHGSNSSINVIYSGTMSAAMEGAIEGIPSIGFSLLNYSMDADFTAAKRYSRKIASNVLKHSIPAGTLLNVNIPSLSLEQIKGVKICRQAMAKWEEEFDERLDPSKRKYYWLTGKFINYDHGEDTDEWALRNGYISVVPVQYDFTAHHAIPFLNKLNFDIQSS